jgi:hypothetical protein
MTIILEPSTLRAIAAAYPSIASFRRSTSDYVNAVVVASMKRLRDASRHLDEMTPVEGLDTPSQSG